LATKRASCRVSGLGEWSYSGVKRKMRVS
jgi:hypothetical protein